jgi:hypothetical protein
MSSVVDGYVKYYPSGQYYIVGDNKTTYGNGITQSSYSGEIVIKEFINGKEVIEIGQYAFTSCQIKNVTIYAKIRSINTWAFTYCTKLEYLNIPSTVTFIAQSALYLGNGSSITLDFGVIIEFDRGRTQKVFIGDDNFCRRTPTYVIYPSTLPPLYSSISTAWRGVTNYSICAPSVFDFYTKQTTTDMTKCPIYRYIYIYVSNECGRNTCKINTTPLHIITASFLISFLTKA